MNLNDKQTINNIKFLSAATLFAGLLSYFIFIKMRDKKEVDEIIEEVEKKQKESNILGGNEFFGGFSKDSEDYKKLPNKQPPFKLGDKSKIIYDIQNKMNEKYGTRLKLDGILGENTLQELCKHVWTACLSEFSWTYRFKELTQKDIDKIFE